MKTASDYLDNKLSGPQHVTFENSLAVLVKGNLLKYFFKHGLVMPPAMLASLAVCILAGFAFGRLRFPLRLPIFLTMLFLMIFPQMLLSIILFGRSPIDT